jgi:hypothetical protein
MVKAASNRFSQLKSTATEGEIEALANQVAEELTSITLFDVFCKLRQGDADGAIRSIELYTHERERIKNLIVFACDKQFLH